MRVVEGVFDVADVDAFVAELGDVGAGTDAAVQAFDARYVVDEAHLESAVAHADRAFERGENVARERAVEILLYAAGRRQISQALAMGVSEGETPAVVVIDGSERTSGSRIREEHSSDRGDEDAAAERVRELDAYEPAETLGVAADEDRITDFYEITPAERDATTAGLSALVRERVALLDVEK